MSRGATNFVAEMYLTENSITDTIISTSYVEQYDIENAFSSYINSKKEHRYESSSDLHKHHPRAGSDGK